MVWVHVWNYFSRPNGKPILGTCCTFWEAGLDGIINKIDAPDPVETNIYSMSPEERKEAGIIDLPSTLRNALKALKQMKWFRQALGNHIYTNFLDAKRMEWASYATFVSQWEIDNYLDIY